MLIKPILHNKEVEFGHMFCNFFGQTFTEEARQRDGVNRELGLFLVVIREFAIFLVVNRESGCGRDRETRKKCKNVA